VLFAWELGANFGHANKIARAAERLQDQVDLFVAAREVAAIRQIAPDLKTTLLPAPYARTRRLSPGEHPPANFAAMLSTEGWHDPAALGATIEAWRSLFDLVQPDVIVAQAAPTALLAAWGSGRKTVILGGGYDNPPLSAPMVPFDGENPALAEIAESQEAAVLACANDALALIGAPRAENFCDLMACDLSLLMTWPEIDHYENRAQVHPDHPPYLGALLGTGQGVEMDWAGRNGARILAYLRPGSPFATSGLRALAAAGPAHDIILSAPGIAPVDHKALTARGVQVSDKPVRLDRLLPDCDLGLSHASNGVGAAFLQAGVRQVGLPAQREQAMFARKLARSGLGLGIEGQFGPEVVNQAIRQALSDKTMKNRVREVADEIAARNSIAPDQAAAIAIKQLI
jgi:hypothetical protein